MKTKSLSIFKKVALLSASMIILTALFIGLFTFFINRSDILHENSEKATFVSSTIADMFSGDEVAAILSANEKNQYWSQMKSSIDKVLVDTNAAYIYIIDKNHDDNVRYFMGADADGVITESNDFNYTDAADAYADEMYATLETGKPQYSDIYEVEGYGVFVSGFAPILDSSGKVVAVVGTDMYVSDVLANSNAFGVKIAIIIVVSSVLFSFLIFAFVKRYVGKPLGIMQKTITKIGTYGDTTFSDAEIAEISELTHTRDEIAQCMDSLMVMINHLNSVTNSLTIVSQGRLDTKITPLSDADLISKSLIAMLDSLGETFQDIQNTSVEVASNARSVADSSLSLAQGATEQAATVDVLAKSIESVSSKIMESASKAEFASKVAADIKAAAEKGSSQMHNMLDAVAQITDASASINKVIKVIDDIAFQTNILALNAAVEAARAGQHGKGFAVVAEEVRNLAAKSAEAASETGSLIENSIEKAELGAAIAKETSESLAEIVDGINKSNTVVNEIAEASKAQTMSISSIHQGISQVGEVVTLISRGAELSSLASDTMHKQSEALHEFVSRYQQAE